MPRVRHQGQAVRGQPRDRLARHEGKCQRDRKPQARSPVRGVARMVVSHYGRTLWPTTVLSITEAPPISGDQGRSRPLHDNNFVAPAVDLTGAESFARLPPSLRDQGRDLRRFQDNLRRRV